LVGTFKVFLKTANHCRRSTRFTPDSMRNWVKLSRRMLLATSPPFLQRTNLVSLFMPGTAHRCPLPWRDYVTCWTTIILQRQL